MLRPVRKISLTILVLGAFTLGCQEKTYGPPADRHPVEQMVVEPVQPQSPQIASETGTFPVPKTFEDILSSKPDAATLITRVVRPLETFILNSGTLNSVSLTATSDFFHYLRAYHQALLTLVDAKDADPAQVRAHLVTYEQTILAPCLRSENSCQNLKVVAHESRYTSVVLTLTRWLDLTPETRWNYSFYALDFNISPLSRETRRQFFDTAREYLRSIPADNSPDSVTKLRIASDRINQIASIMNDEDPELLAFVESMRLWSHEGNDPARDAVRSALWPRLITAGPYRKDGSLSPSFGSWMGTELTRYTQELITPFEKDPLMQRMWTSFQIKDPRSIDSTLTFIFDQLYFERLKRDDAIRLIRFKKPGFDRILQVAREYVRLRFAYMTFQTHSQLKVALADRAHYRSINEMRESLLKARDSEIMWANFISRLATIRDVVENASVSETTEISREQRDRLDSTFSQMDRQIKWLVTYPNMLPVMYFISKANLSQTFKFLWWTITLTSDTIFDLLYSGQLNTWFNFTGALEDHSYFTAAEVLLAFQNALSTEVFSDYGISPGLFILESIDRLTTVTSVDFDKAIESLSKDIVIGRTYRQEGYHRDQSETDVFRRAMAFCRGESTEEKLQLGELEDYLVGYQQELTNTLAASAIFTSGITTPGSFSATSLVTFTDSYRTDASYNIDMVEKLRDIYKTYLRETNQTDDQMAVIDAKIEALHARTRKFFGLLYYARNQYADCMPRLMEIAQRRQLTALEYEEMYLHRVHRDLDILLRDPSQLAAINATYALTYPELRGLKARDHFEKTAHGIAFVYSKIDFLMRVKQYLEKGTVDPRNGTVLAAIAPHLKIEVPFDLQRDNRSKYDYFFTNEYEQSFEVTPAEGADALYSKAFTMLFNQTTELGFFPGGRVRAFMRWWGPMNNSDLSNIMGAARLGFDGALMKLGPVEVYDFAKDGCTSEMTFEDLDAAGCRTTMQYSARRAYEDQMRLLGVIGLSDETVAMFKKTGTPSLYDTVGTIGGWHHVFFSLIDSKPIGVLDSFRYLMSQPALGDNLVWPGQPPSDSVSQPPMRFGLLTRAMAYFRTFDAYGQGDFMRVRPEMDGNIKGLYDSYVAREFAPQNELEKLADELTRNGDTGVDVRLKTFEPPFHFPIRGNFVQRAEILQTDFNLATKNIFKNAVPSSSPH
jgi:hypothetical protein